MVIQWVDPIAVYNGQGFACGLDPKGQPAIQRNCSYGLYLWLTEMLVLKRTVWISLPLYGVKKTSLRDVCSMISAVSFFSWGNSEFYLRPVFRKRKKIIKYLAIIYIILPSFWQLCEIVYASRMPPTRFVVCVSVGTVDASTCDANGLRVSGSLDGKVGELG